MAYLEKQDLVDELGERDLIQLTADDPDAEEPDDERIQKAIEYARGTFDSYARSRYSIPVPVTPLVKSLNLDLAIYHLQKSRTTKPGGLYDVRKNAADEAMKLLKDIAAGKAGLDVPAAEETKENPATQDRILTNAAKNKFTDKTLRGF